MTLPTAGWSTTPEKLSPNRTTQNGSTDGRSGCSATAPAANGFRHRTDRCTGNSRTERAGDAIVVALTEGDGTAWKSLMLKDGTWARDRENEA